MHLTKQIAARDSNDKRTWERVYSENYYGAPEEFRAGDVVLDLGAGIGSFSRLCMDRGARVFAVEPASKTIPLYYLNTHHYYCTLFKVAVWGDENLPRVCLVNGSLVSPLPDNLEEYVNEDPNSTRLVHPTKKDSAVVEYIDVLPLTVLILLLGRNIRFLKVSVEGAEYAVIYNTPPNLLTCCWEIVVECYNDSTNNEEGIRKYLTEIGYKMVAAKQVKKDHHLLRFSL